MTCERRDSTTHYTAQSTSLLLLRWHAGEILFEFFFCYLFSRFCNGPPRPRGDKYMNLTVRLRATQSIHVASQAWRACACARANRAQSSLRRLLLSNCLRHHRYALVKKSCAMQPAGWIWRRPYVRFWPPQRKQPVTCRPQCKFLVIFTPLHFFNCGQVCSVRWGA